MNLPSTPHHEEIFDRKLKNYLKNWIDSAPMPTTGKERLLSTASRNPKPLIHKKRALLSNFLFLVFDDHFLLMNQNDDIIYSARRYNQSAALYGFHPRLTMHFS